MSKLSGALSFPREVNENNALLKEQANSLESKLKRAELRAKELAELQVENEVCQPGYRTFMFALGCIQMPRLKTTSRQFWPIRSLVQFLWV